MPKPNVDIVTLVATQELSTAVGPDKTWYIGMGNSTVGNKITNKGTIETIGTIISEQIGSASDVPDRAYHVSALPPGVTITNDGTGFPRILNDPYLDGKDFSLFRRGTEYMEKGPQWQNDVAGGGIRLTGVGDQFESGQDYFLIFKPVISNVIVTPDAIGKFSAGEAIITATSVASAANDRKIIIIQGSTTAAVTYTLRAPYPENVVCTIETGGGTNKQSIILAPAGQTLWRGGTISRLILGQLDYVIFVRIGTVWRVVACGDRYKRVLHLVMGGIPGPDVISANGQTLQIADYPGVDDALTALNTALPGSVITVGAWATDNTKWARDATSIRVPKLGGWFPRFLDLGNGKDPDRGSAGNIVGSSQANQNKAHNHNAGGYDKLLQNDGHGTIVNFDDSSNPNDPNLLSAFPMVSNGGSESRGENVGLPALIYI